jgi:hypothetical protein
MPAIRDHQRSSEISERRAERWHPPHHHHHHHHQLITSPARPYLLK